ncbi:MAG TPA: UPF0182 family protein [Kineosporiaceae bacterium]|nr:UPF0182 family protein [Kineosporiaceae bacterium]
MSYEADPRRGPRRPVLSRRRRGALAPTLAIVGVLVVLGFLFASVWTDLLWYGQLGFTSVYRTELLTKAGLFLIGGLLMAGAVLISLVIAYRSRPVYAPVSSEHASLDRYRESVEPLRRLVVIAVPAGLALFAGSAASQQWQTFLLWWNSVPFGKKDAQFHLDIGFFVFTLPWLQFLSGFFTAVVFLSGIAALVTHYLYGGLRLQGTGPRMTQTARVHLSVLAALFLLLRAIDYWLGRYALTTHDSRLITGLTYTDARALLTAKGVLAGIALIVAVLFVVAAVMERTRALPLYGVALLLVSAILLNGIYPAIVQRFQVKPSEASLESPYIKRNIDATRDAYGLSNVQVDSYPGVTQATPDVLRNAAEAIPGIRLLDPNLVGDTFRAQQALRPYYTFGETMDVDRYVINGKESDTVLAVRELNLEGVPAAQRGWNLDHIVYTHGYGVVAAYGNVRTTDGSPAYYEQDLPPTGPLQAAESRIYFGENSPDYSIVGAPSGSGPRELDYPADNAGGQKLTTYTGKGGVSIGSTVNRLLYALKFREQNILLSDAVNGQSRILYDRSPRDRVEKVAPYLTLDGDPYPAVVDKADGSGRRVVWILDGYTTSSQYPYSKLTNLNDVTSDSLTNNSTNVVALQSQQVNYMRNSVKAVVDAYDGSVSLYAWDDQDPVLKVWRKTFPTTVRPLSELSGDVMSHVRYPEDLFKVQRTLLSKYHVQDPSAFYNSQDFWSVPTDPTDQATSQQLQPPYYLSLQMPNTDKPRFSLTSTYVPTGATRVLTGFLAVDSDAGNQAGLRRADYGKFRLLQLPRDSSVPGPGQVQNKFSEPAVGTTLNILRANGSKVETGNLLTVPLGGGLLYVQPVYVKSNQAGAYPLLQKVLAVYGAKIGFADTLDLALNQVFSNNGTGAATGGGTTSGGSSPSTSTSPSAGGTGPGTATGAQAELAAALKDAQAAITAADAALKAGDLAGYAEAEKRVAAAVSRAIAAQQRLPVPAASAAPSATPSSVASGSASTTG